MVLQQTYSPRQGAQPRLDVNRILGISSTLALNVLALAMLLTPMTLPSPPAPAEHDADIQVVPIVPVRRVTPPPPEVVPVTPPRAQTPPRLRDTPVAPPAADVPVLVDQGVFVEAVADAPAAQDTAVAMDPPGPLAGVQLQYDRAPSPPYPRLAIQRGLEGVVLLRILVDIDGRPLEVGIEQSSGHAVLDREAVRHVQRHWTFRPAVRDGQPVQAVGIVPIDYRLGRG